MPSKKRKYNARFPAGRIKKIMQTDEEVGKVAQAVPIIISRTLELFVKSLLSKAMQVTMARNAKTLSPSHVKQCILSESRFDFLRDLVSGDHSSYQGRRFLNSELFHLTPRTLELFVKSLLSKAMQVTMARNAKTLSPSHVKQCILSESRFDFLRDLASDDHSSYQGRRFLNSELFHLTPRTLELFVKSLLSKAMQVTMARNAKTLSPSHVKQCILSESRFDFLRDLVSDDHSSYQGRRFLDSELFHLTPRTLELFVKSLLSKAMQVTMARNAKTLSPSHVKQYILSESRFDFLRDLVKNIPDVSAAEEKELMSAESSPNSSRFPEAASQPVRVARQDSTSSSSCDVRAPPALDPDLPRPHRTEVTSTIVSTDTAIDLTKRPGRPVRTANFYQETLLTDEVQHRSVITLNPTYASPQPSTSFTKTPDKDKPDYPPDIPPLQRIDLSAVPKQVYAIDVQSSPPTPVTPVLNIDFTKNIAQPEIKVLDTAVANIVGVKEPVKSLKRQNSKPVKTESKRIEVKPILSQPVDIDHLNSGNLQIDEDYDT